MSAAELRLELARTRDALLAPLRELTEEQFRHAPAGGEWPIAAHLAHVLRVERHFVERMRLAMREDEPRVPSTGATNDDDPALAQHYAVPQIIHGLQASRRDLTQILEACGDDGLERAINHERRGRITIRTMAEKMREHDAEHAETIEKIAQEARTARRVIIPLAQRQGTAG